MAGKYLTLSATGVVLGLIGSICICVAFFTSNWLTVLETIDVDTEEQDNTNIQETAESPMPGNYGLWGDKAGSSESGSFSSSRLLLTCTVMPFNVCMYTRVGLFSSVILIVPGMLLALLSAAVLASHGQIHTTGTLARASSSMFLLACVGAFAGMMAFTLQQTVCISTCPPDYEFFPLVKDGDAEFAWSFYLGWVGSGMLLMASSALLALSCEAAGQVRESKFAVNRALNNPLEMRPNALGASQAFTEHSGKV